MEKSRQSGFTIIELMVTLTIFAILMSLAVPGMSTLVEKRRLVGAAEEIYNRLQFARSEAIKQSSDMRVSFDEGEWCIGTNDNGADCDCSVTDETAADACTISIVGTDVLTRVSGSDFPQITMAQNFGTNSVTFNNVRGVVDGNTGTVTLTSPRGWELRVITNILGRVSICSPAGTNNVGGYPECV